MIPTLPRCASRVSCLFSVAIITLVIRRFSPVISSSVKNDQPVSNDFSSSPADSTVAPLRCHFGYC